MSVFGFLEIEMPALFSIVRQQDSKESATTISFNESTVNK
jgi:hypothetical protein